MSLNKPGLECSQGVALQKKFLLIPYWVKTVLDRHRLDYPAVQDLSQLFPLFSLEDLAQTLTLNKPEHSAMVFGVGVATDLLYDWSKQGDLFAKVEQIELLQQPTLMQRLFDQTAALPHLPKPYDIKDIDKEHVLIIVYPGHFGGPNALIYQSQLREDLLKLSYAYSTFDVMAGNVLFERYVNEL